VDRRISAEHLLEGEDGGSKAVKSSPTNSSQPVGILGGNCKSSFGVALKPSGVKALIEEGQGGRAAPEKRKGKS